MKLIKLEELDIIPLEEIRRKLEQKNEKRVIESEELNIDEIKSNLVINVILYLKNLVNH